jgi:hypothetical protein
VVAQWVYIVFICFLGKLGFSTSTVSDDIPAKVKSDPDQNAYQNLHHPLNLTSVKYNLEKCTVEFELEVCPERARRWGRAVLSHCY